MLLRGALSRFDTSDTGRVKASDLECILTKAGASRLSASEALALIEAVGKSNDGEIFIDGGV